MLNMCVLCLSFLDHHFCENAEFAASFHHVKNAFFFPLSIFTWMHMLTCTHMCPYIHMHCHSSCSACLCVYNPTPTFACVLLCTCALSHKLFRSCIRSSPHRHCPLPPTQRLFTSHLKCKGSLYGVTDN